MNEDQSALGRFAGSARLFPLPNLVLFPHVAQPLHVFEPRYRRLTADTLAGDRLMAVVLLQPGWEGDYEGRPPVYPVACLGHVIADKKLPDGRYHLLLRGLARIRLTEELADGKPYRTSRAEVLAEAPAPPAEAKGLRRQLAEAVLPRLPSGPAGDQLRELIGGELPLGPLCDVLGFALPLALERKQGLLAEPDVAARARALLELLTAERRFPPEFSAN
jgi:uncharacterized protein